MPPVDADTVTNAAQGAGPDLHGAPLVDAPEQRELTPPVRMALQIIWPAFLMAGVIEALVFSVVDPASLHWFGGEPIDWPVQAVYTAGFFMFWLSTALSAALTRALMTFEDDVRLGR